MFSLENAVDSWCESITAGKQKQTDLQDELKDHLYCEIEALQQDGLSEEQAFTVAVRKLGEPQELLSEYRSNRRVFSLMCNKDNPSLNEYTQQRSNVMSYKKNVARIIGQALIWAAVILSSALLLSDAEHYMNFLLLLVVLSSTAIVMDPGYKETARLECRFIKRVLGIGQKA